MVDKRRILLLNGRIRSPGPVTYWMSRDQRVQDNWALLFAQELALEQKQPMVVLFCLVPQFLGATWRHYDFMIQGLREIEKDLSRKNVPFFLKAGDPEEEIQRFVSEHNIGAVVTDFDPLRIKREWKHAVADRLNVAFYEVDAHNIVPCWVASPKQEVGARTFRPKIRARLPEFLKPMPSLQKHPFQWKRGVLPVDWDRVVRTVRCDAIPPVTWMIPGEKQSLKALRRFIDSRLASYAEARNDPATRGLSDLSPYLHFGQLSAQRVALDVCTVRIAGESKEAFLEQLIVRRELADNFCYYNTGYDSVKGFPAWAAKSLAEHVRDRKLYRYTREELEQAETHDQLWNAAQLEMVRRGKMHGYLRMYWGKKILEWTRYPEEALQIAIYLNDRYELDGRDPNGYTGIAWSIGGVHDRPWPVRPIFGTIRYMSYNGARSKFDIEAYIESVPSKPSTDGPSAKFS